MERDIEMFPVQKRQVRLEEPPELIFFDVDEDTDEAEFIRVDDLFASEAEPSRRLTGHLSFTLFPAGANVLIDRQLTKLIHRGLLVCCLRIGKPLEKVRIRPFFAQWQIELSPEDEAEQVAKEFRADLESLIHPYLRLPEEERFWSENCFISPIDKEIPDETIIRAAALYHEKNELRQL